MRPTLAIGTSDFRKIRDQGSLYVDKTLLLQRFLEDGGETLLLPRPRRFGKTTNLSMIRYFLEKTPEDLSYLYQDLAIWRWEGAKNHFQRYPVIALTLKDLKKSTWAQCLNGIRELLSKLYKHHEYLLTSNVLGEREVATFRAILRGSADQAQCERALHDLSEYLHLYHQQTVVILIDEYDTPIHEAFSRGYYDEAISFFRSLLSGALKDNVHLFRGLLTGIMRIARESIFSDLNNLNVYTLLSPYYASHFGFTESEVESILSRSGSRRTMEELREWYNGYSFGGQVVYNPWSVINAVQRDQEPLRPYWSQTASDLRELLLGSSGLDQDLETLVSGQGLRAPLIENIALSQIRRQPEVLWSFLLFTGYLTARDLRREHDDAPLTAELSIPNSEIRAVFRRIFLDFLSAGLGGQRQVELMGEALLQGDRDSFAQQLTRLLVESVSALDLSVGQKRLPPEQLYHVFVLGLLLHLQPRYQVRSNRESGYGRYDVLIHGRDPGRPGVVLELKVRRKGQTLKQALKEAQAQLRDRDYAAELRALGAAPIHLVAVAFDGKKLLVG